jgi:hypothetical protein
MSECGFNAGLPGGVDARMGDAGTAAVSACAMANMPGGGWAGGLTPVGGLEAVRWCR